MMAETVEKCGDTVLNGGEVVCREDSLEREGIREEEGKKEGGTSGGELSATDCSSKPRNEEGVVDETSSNRDTPVMNGSCAGSGDEEAESDKKSESGVDRSMAGKRRTKRMMEKALHLFDEEEDGVPKKLTFEGDTPEIGGRAKWLERQREREIKNKRLSKQKDGSYFSYMFLEKIFRESRKCKLCSARDSGKPFTDDESSLELYVTEKGVCGRQRLICNSCGGVQPIISCDNESEIPDKAEFRIDGSTVRYYCKKVMHFDVLHDLMELLHIAALESDNSRKQKHLELAEFMLHNARKVCKEWCRPESSELRSKKFLRLREEALLLRYRPVFTADHNEEYRDMYQMMAGSFRQHREKIKLLLELLKTTLFDNPTYKSFMLWVSIAMVHTEVYPQFKKMYDAISFMQVDSTDYQALKDRYLTLSVAVGVKKIPIIFVLFELPRFYHYIEFLKERVGGKERPTQFLTEEEQRTLEKFDRQAHKYMAKRKVKSGKLVSMESNLDVLMQREEFDREMIFRNTQEKQRLKQEDRKLYKKQKKEERERLALAFPPIRQGFRAERGASSRNMVVREISDSLDFLERKQRRERLPYPPFRQRVMGAVRERTSLERDMVADMTLRKPYKSRFELLLEEEDRQWGMDGNWSRKDVLLCEDDMMFERKVCMRFKKPDSGYNDTIPVSMSVLPGAGRMPTQAEVQLLMEQLVEEEVNPTSFDGAGERVFHRQKKREENRRRALMEADVREGGGEEEEEEEEAAGDLETGNDESKAAERDGEGAGKEEGGAVVVAEGNEMERGGERGGEVEGEKDRNDKIESKRGQTEAAASESGGREEGGGGMAESIQEVVGELKTADVDRQAEEVTESKEEKMDDVRGEEGERGSVVLLAEDEKTEPEEEKTEKLNVSSDSSEYMPATDVLEGEDEIVPPPDTAGREEGGGEVGPVEGDRPSEPPEPMVLAEVRGVDRHDFFDDDGWEFSEDEEEEDEETSAQLQSELQRVLSDVNWGKDAGTQDALQQLKEQNFFISPGGMSGKSATVLLEMLRNTTSGPEVPIHRYTIHSTSSGPRATTNGPHDPLAASIADVCAEYLTNNMPDKDENGEAIDPNNPPKSVIMQAVDKIMVAIVSEEVEDLPPEISRVFKRDTLELPASYSDPQISEIHEDEEEEEEKRKEGKPSAKSEAQGTPQEAPSTTSEKSTGDKDTPTTPTAAQVDTSTKPQSEGVTTTESVAVANSTIEDQKRAEREEREEKKREKREKKSKRRTKKMEKKAKKLVEAVQRRKALEERYWAKKILKRSPSEEAFEELLENKRDATLAELTPEEKRILMDHCHRPKQRKDEWDRKMMGKTQGPEGMRSRLRQKLYDRKMDDDYVCSRRNREVPTAESKASGDNASKSKRKSKKKETASNSKEDSTSANEAGEIASPTSPPVHDPEKMAEVREKLEKMEDDSLPKSEPMKSKLSDSSKSSKPKDDAPESESQPEKDTPESPPDEEDEKKEEQGEEEKPSTNPSLNHKSLENAKSSKVPAMTMPKQLRIPTHPEKRMVSHGQFRSMLVDQLKDNEKAEHNWISRLTTPPQPVIRATVNDKSQPLSEPSLSLPVPSSSPPAVTIPPLKLTSKQKKDAKKLIRKHNKKLLVAQVDTQLLRERGFNVKEGSTAMTAIFNEDGEIEQVLDGVDTPEQVAQYLGGNYNMVTTGIGHLSLPGDDESDQDSEPDSGQPTLEPTTKPKLETAASPEWDVDEGREDGISGFPLTSKWSKEKRGKFKEVLMKGLSKAIPLDQPEEMEKKASPPRDEMVELEEEGEKERAAMLAEEREAEKREKKRRQRKEKKKASKLKREAGEKDGATGDKEEEKETDKVTQDEKEEEKKVETTQDEAESAQVEPQPSSTVPPPAEREIVTYKRRKPKEPPFDPAEIFRGQTAESIGMTPLMLTNAPSYITLTDMEDVELNTDTDNTNPGCFIYKVSVANGGMDHPFKDVYRFATKRRGDLDVMVEVSPIACYRNMEDVLCLANKPGRVAYSGKLQVRELRAPYGTCDLTVYVHVL